MPQPTIKIIQVSDHYQDNSNQYPYILSIGSNVKLRLRSKICYDHEPVLLIQKFSEFESLLPLKSQTKTNSPFIIDNFQVLRGQLDKNGSWLVNIPTDYPRILSFQIGFILKGTSRLVRFGSNDVILLTQNKIDIRKLKCMSVFPRCIGKSQYWSEFFQSQIEIGYNAFHLAPIQESGASNSYYSIKVHDQLSKQVFDGSKQQLSNILNPLKRKGATFFVDIVLNHVSFDSEWVKSNPQVVYTLQNTPILFSAFQVDREIYEWGQQIKQIMGGSTSIQEEQVLEFQSSLKTRIDTLALHEFFMLSKDIKSQLLEAVAPRKPSQNLFAKDPIDSILEFIEANEYGVGTSRNGVKISNLDVWVRSNVAYQKKNLDLAIRAYNQKWKKVVTQQWIPQIISNTMNQFRHNYVSNKYRRFNDSWPLINKYFSQITKKNNSCFYALNNGWIKDADARSNFATSSKFYYLRRRVNVWGDLLRIRYGNNPQDSPQAWNYMLKYVREMARHFDGFRLDNLHGTQIVVGQYMVRQARKINPNLVIFGELFVQSEKEQAFFLRKIGVNSTLLEGVHMDSGSSFIHHLHGSLGNRRKLFGSLSPYIHQGEQIIKYAVRKKPVKLVYDLTHDNLTFIQRGKMHLQTPFAVGITMMGSFMGSTKGYDQFYSHKILVTQTEAIYKKDKHKSISIDNSQIQKVLFIYEDPQSSIQGDCQVFGSWDEWAVGQKLARDQTTKRYSIILNLPPGAYQYKYRYKGIWTLVPNVGSNRAGNHELILKGKEKALKLIHFNLETIRKQLFQNSNKYYGYNEYYYFHQGDVVSIFKECPKSRKSISIIFNLSKDASKLKRTIQLPGLISNCKIWHQDSNSYNNGLTTQCQIVEHQNIRQFFFLQYDTNSRKEVLIANCLPPGFACIIECHKDTQTLQNIQLLDELQEQHLDLQPLGALDLNLILYGCTREQQNKYGCSNYIVPQDNNKQLVYGGFAGVIKEVSMAKITNNLLSKLFDNLRSGHWLLDYYIQRLKRFNNLHELTDRIEKTFQLIKYLPQYLAPKYFTDFIYKFCLKIQTQQCHNKSNLLQSKLVLAAPQFIGAFNSDIKDFEIQFSAGLPHFSVGWARCWGRDTFICNELLLCYPNIYRGVILQYAKSTRHGLIPNLLDGGNNPRFNSRDACWWFLRGVYCYIKKTKDTAILKEKIEMIFPSGDQIQCLKMKNQNKKKILLLEQILHNIFQSHAEGIHYREWHAGVEIDCNMHSKGFNIELGIDEQTGLIEGGNQRNCLTWMDKMGSSAKSGNKSYPATPRAGCPVELSSLLYYCLKAFYALYQEGSYPFNSVKYKQRTFTYEEWAQRIKLTFEKSFWVQQNNQQAKIGGIFKDLYHGQSIYAQLKLRPNALIMLALTPELVCPDKARSYLQKVEQYLINQKSIGVSTLANVHTSIYSPFYDNSDDSSNPIIAHGFSYHNGPQWVWLYGFYIVAKVRFNEGKSRSQIMSLMQSHLSYILSDEWVSLPQLTNVGGKENQYSCNAQAWSISSLFFALQQVASINESAD